MKARMKHDIKVDGAYKHPRLMGLENVVLSAKEVILFENEQVKGIIDNLYYDGKIWIISEYKLNDNNVLNALEQLEKYNKHFDKYNLKDKRDMIFTGNYRRFK